MQPEQLIPVTDFCTHHHIEISFIGSLQASGLIEVTTIEEMHFISVDQVNELEKFIRLHYDLDINIEGMEAIIHLLNRVTDMQAEIRSLRNKLRLYE